MNRILELYRHSSVVGTALPDSSLPLYGGRKLPLASASAPLLFPNRCSKYGSVSSSPDRRSIFGSQPSNALALLISGQRSLGSSCGSGSKRILLDELVSLSTSFAHLLLCEKRSEMVCAIRVRLT